MRGRTFLDTNVLVYAFDSAEPRKKERALAVLEQAPDPNALVISTQVLQEFFVAVTRRLETPLDHETAARAVEDLTALPVVVTGPETVLAAVRRCGTASLSFWDALIVEAALGAGCATLLTEDLQDGRSFGPLAVVNPFRDP